MSNGRKDVRVKKDTGSPVSNKYTKKNVNNLLVKHGLDKWFSFFMGDDFVVFEFNNYNDASSAFLLLKDNNFNVRLEGWDKSRLRVFNLKK